MGPVQGPILGPHTRRGPDGLDLGPNAYMYNNPGVCNLNLPGRPHGPCPMVGLSWAPLGPNGPGHNGPRPHGPPGPSNGPSPHGPPGPEWVRPSWAPWAFMGAALVGRAIMGPPGN